MALCLHKPVCMLTWCKGPLEHSDIWWVEVGQYVASYPERSNILHRVFRFVPGVFFIEPHASLCVIVKAFATGTDGYWTVLPLAPDNGFAFLSSFNTVRECRSKWSFFAARWLHICQSAWFFVSAGQWVYLLPRVQDFGHAWILHEI